MTRTVQIDELANAIAQELEGYGQDIAEALKHNVDIVSNEAMQEIKNHIEFDQKTGDYVRAFRIKTTEDTKYNKTKVWHVAKPWYRLTHLLEKGHALRNGNRSRAYPHIQFGEVLAQKRLFELMKGVIDNLNR